MMKPEEKEKALQIYEDWHIAKSFEIDTGQKGIACDPCLFPLNYFSASASKTHSSEE